MLRRELEHKGLDKANRGFEAKLIAWLEAVIGALDRVSLEVNE